MESAEARMSTWPRDRFYYPAAEAIITSSQIAKAARNDTNAASTAWPSANLAIFVPFVLRVPTTVYKIVVGGGSLAAGNFDVGIYDQNGNRLVSSGAQAKSASVEHVVNITDTPLGPGRYYMAMAADGTNNYVMYSVSAASRGKLGGVLQAASSYVLPATVTFATFAQTDVPSIGLYLRGD